ncbi:hypothetical protein TNCV_1313381 [Trichonephila clavipes]|nr:hypothetical protein TNCV_1313381 [Trichonephila clavipes]
MNTPPDVKGRDLETSFNLCRGVGTHRRKFRLCKVGTTPHTNTCEEVSDSNNFIYITCEEVKSVESHNVFFNYWIHRTCEQQGARKRNSPLVSMEKEKKGRTAADSVQSGWPIVAAKAKQSSRAGAAN